MFGKDMDKMTIDPETLKKILLKGDDDEFITNSGVITLAPNSHVYFYCDVLPDSILKLNSVLIQLAKENLADAASKNKDKPEPINLHIQSNGGLCSAGFIGYDVIRAISQKIEIYSFIEGYAASAATLLSVGCSKRYITESSNMLIHELSTFIGGKLSEITQDYHNSLKIQNRIEEIYIRHSKMEKDELQELLKKDVLLTAEESISKGLVDEIKTSIF